MTTRRYALLIPVKDARSAKTRLGVGDGGQRARLMAAFAQDSIAAAAASPWVSVYVVGDPDALADQLGDLGVPVLPDEGGGSLNRALERAAVRISAQPDLAGVAVMLADLPCLRTADLDSAFAAARGRAYVADAEGSGTTLLIAPAGTPLDPRFGAGSAAAHAASGAEGLTGELSSLRQDVDTTDDLEAALRFGVGVRTAQVASSLL
ncbi:2-phospho-L-lactate guanylyltransferase [Nocardioides marmoriginsengisoli]|uniref:Phosphoenolpyruvate guanylyltransferase n=1 Tax=Nocardioides marmoriginsengisoli TaxID=661483 RepID=A0A3N0CNV8_9ACTN|nr:2-phospho-L-lactate guanylyltransferase [Nocardioides marmoriginsengisoli]RNL65164.1 2-phospho-L-lactate guanylyltransferase [Nocardioides marmoriginsengisoli]